MLRTLITFIFVVAGVFLVKPCFAEQLTVSEANMVNTVKTIYPYLMNIPTDTVLGMIQTESNFRPGAIGDGGNAIGLMQMTFPATSDTVKGKYPYLPPASVEALKNPWVNIIYGIHYLKMNNDVLGNLDQTIRSYNGGLGGINWNDTAVYLSTVKANTEKVSAL